jgi:predicted MFS family arabinose efflux permease
MASDDGHALRADSPWWIHRDFAYLWIGQAFSNIGDALLDTSLVFVVVTGVVASLHQSWAPLAVSGLLMLEIVPSLVLRPLAGVWVDRWNARRTMIVVDGLRALVLVGYWGAYAFTSQAGWQWRLAATYGLVLAVSVGAQYFNPAQMVLLADIVPEPSRARATGFSLITSMLALVLGPALAAPIYFLLGIKWVLAADFISYSISCSTVWAIAKSRGYSTPGGEPQRFWRDFRAGLHLFVTQPVLRTVAISLAVAMLGIGILQSLNVFFVTQQLHASVSWFGYLQAAFGAGSILGGAVGIAWVARVGLMRAFASSMCAVGMLLVLYAWTGRFWLALCIFGLMGIPNAVNNVAASPLVLRVTPSAFVGRIFALLAPAWSSVFSLSLFLSGLIYSGISAHRPVLVFGKSVNPLTLLLTLGGGLVLAGGFYAHIALKRAAPDELPRQMPG